MRVSVAVAGGYGETQLDCPGSGESAGLIAPDATPNYDFYLYNREGQVVLSARGITRQKETVRGHHKLSPYGNLVVIANAADDGAYAVDLPLNARVR